MKKELLSAVLCIALAGTLLSGCSGKTDTTTQAETAAVTAAETAVESAQQDKAEKDTQPEKKEGLKIGATIQDLGQFWANVMKQIEKRAEEDGNTFTYVSCEDTSSKQIEQIENFISSGCDVILVHPSDQDAVENVCQQARDKGIKVMCWDNLMTNTDLNWVIDNEALGYMVGEQASQFIKEHFGEEKVEVAVLGYPQTDVLRQRENGILNALEELAPTAEIVANQPALDTTAALNATETILQAHPDLKVVCTVGCVRSIGANEVFKAKGIDVSDIGIFGVDGTDEEMESMMNDEAIRMSVMITGTAKTCGDEVYDILVDLGNGKTFEEHDIYRDIFPVTKENAAEYYGK